ncbi:hypothetical protein AWZ03_013211 [Drosophila navojoa]|uniref:Uncharacterized protein n=1 Tax=Drosophila navojoa TaxID=7232 RepID=A0A484AXS6_DRONA|nr:hypothetical protein AWZ03_013211 [Drosophila navojoa]
MPPSSNPKPNPNPNPNSNSNSYRGPSARLVDNCESLIFIMRRPSSKDTATVSASSGAAFAGYCVATQWSVGNCNLLALR